MQKTIPFHEITCVRKAKTAAVFPNAIEIVTGDKKVQGVGCYCMVSFFSNHIFILFKQ